MRVLIRISDEDYRKISNCEEIVDELISIQDAYEQAKEDIYQHVLHVLNKEHNTDKAQGMLNALEMIVERLDKVIWKD